METSLLSSDNNLTTDQYILSVSKKKQSIIDNFYNILKSVSLDCPYNSESIKCFSYNNISYNNLDKEPIYFHNPDSINIKQKNMAAHLMKYNNNYYIIHNNIVYDYEKYVLHSILIKIGNISYDENNNIVLNITRPYSNYSSCYIPSNIAINISKDNIDKSYYGNIQNTYTLVEFVKSGGSAQYNLIHNIENNQNDSDYDIETNIDFDVDIDFDLEESDTNINNIIKLEDSLYNNKEIEIDYDGIYLYIDESKTYFSINNYIALYDLLTQEKIFIGIINKITNYYILVNDTKISIISENEKNFILYKVKNKNIFIDELGNQIFKLYNSSDIITNIYESYSKNNVLDYLVNNILQKIKQYHKTNYALESSDLSEETIDKDLVQDIVKIISESEQSDSLDNLSSENLDSLLFSDTNEIFIKSTSEDFNTLNTLYINIINNYYQYYIDYLNTLKQSLFKNSSFIKINKFLINFIIKKDKSKINYILNIIKIIFLHRNIFIKYV